MQANRCDIFSALLAKFPPDIQAVTSGSFEIARRNMSDVHEFIYHDAVRYSINDSPFDRICYIAPQKKGM
jgi:hypothetical protein